MFTKPKEGVDIAAALVLVAVVEMYVGTSCEGVGEKNDSTSSDPATPIARHPTRKKMVFECVLKAMADPKEGENKKERIRELLSGHSGMSPKNPVLT